jgi:hypothetical protein
MLKIKCTLGSSRMLSQTEGLAGLRPVFEAEYSAREEQSREFPSWGSKCLDSSLRKLHEDIKFINNTLAYSSLEDKQSRTIHNLQPTAKYS